MRVGSATVIGAIVGFLLVLTFSVPGELKAVRGSLARNGADRQAVQNPGGQDKAASEIQQKIRVNSDLVVLSVLVKDRAGNLVPNLSADEFEIYDDGIRQNMSVFSDESLPLSLAILMDMDLKWREGSEMGKSLRAIIGGLASGDEVSVCRFDVLFYPDEGFTSDTDKLLSELKAVEKEVMTPPAPTIPQPVTCGSNSTTGPPCVAAPTSSGARPTKALEDALFATAELLQRENKERRRLILLISDGRNELKLNHHKYEEVVGLLLRENISVFTLGLGSDSARKRYGRLAGYSKETGGEIYYAIKSGTMEQLYARITEEARHSYTMAYVPTGSNTGAEYHKIEVRTKRDGVRAETREGYYAKTR